MSSTIAGLRNNSVSEIHHIDSRDTAYASREGTLPFKRSFSDFGGGKERAMDLFAELYGIPGVAWVLVSASGSRFSRASHTSHPRNGDP